MTLKRKLFLCITSAAIAGNLYAVTPGSWGHDRVDQSNFPLDNNFVVSNQGDGVNVYVLDTGINNIADFENRLITRVSFVPGESALVDQKGHGTNVASIVGGIKGVSPNVNLHSVKVLRANLTQDIQNIIDGLDWVIQNHQLPAVVNLSLGGPDSRPNVDQLEAKVQTLVNLGITVVTSAGNDGINACTVSPARMSDVITVGATDQNDERALWSSFNDENGNVTKISNFGSCIDLFAPGKDIQVPNAQTGVGSEMFMGTSASAPFVTGAAAIYLSSNPQASPSEVKNAIVNTSFSGKIAGLDPASPNKILNAKLSIPNEPSTPTGFNVSSMFCFGLNQAIWNASSGTLTQYEVWSSTNSSFTNPQIFMTSPYRFVEFEVSGRTYLKVRACNGDYCSDLSNRQTAYSSNSCF